MKLDELKKMIAEEFESYMREEEDQVDVTVGDADVDLDDATGMEGEAGPEDALEQIYNMLKAYFEADGEDNDMDGVEDEEGEEPIEDIDEAKEEIEEGDGYDGKAGKGGTGYDGKAGKGGTGYDAGSKALQERFKKLANIIK